MKRFMRMLIEQKDFRKDVWIFATIIMLIGFVYPWIAKGGTIIVPMIVKYYEWVSNF